MIGRCDNIDIHTVNVLQLLHDAKGEGFTFIE